MLPTTEHASGKWLFVFILASIIGAAVYVAFSGITTGEVRVLIRAESGERSLATLSLSGGGTTPASGDPTQITTASLRIFREEDGSVLTLDKEGIVRLAGGSKGQKSVLVASVAPPPARTPLAVWNKGARIAWVNPADGSLQVFEKTSFGSYAPIALYAGVFANSIGFTEEGTVLAYAILGESSTDVYAFNLESQTITRVTTLEGLASILP